MRNTLLGILLVLLTVSFTGCQRAQGTAATKQVEFTATADTSPTKEVHYCKGVTVKGDRCKRHVKAEGDYCFQHTIQANPCWRPKGSQPKQDCYYQDGDVTRPIPGKP